MQAENEMGVIVKFAEQAREAGFEMVRIQPQFPDAIVRYQGSEYRAEFELLASNFRSHKHDVRGCDLIICWHNDWPDCILPVIAIETLGWHHELQLDLPTEDQRAVEYWKSRALEAEQRIKALASQQGQWTALSTHAQRAEKVLARQPELGVRELARAIGCAPSTASAIMHRRNGHDR